MKYSERFKDCIYHILRHEGGYVNDPDDAGGETNFGISKHAFPELDIKNMTEEQAVKIYYYHYWVPIKGDQIISNELALQVFDMAVNAGTGAAAKLLQQIVGATPDGAIGPITLKAMDTYPSVAGLIGEYKFARSKYYCNLVIRNPVQVKFLKSWINRIDIK